VEGSGCGLVWGFICLYLEGLRKAMIIFRIASVSVALYATPNVGQTFACVQSYVAHSSLSETVGSCGYILKHHSMVTCGGGGGIAPFTVDFVRGWRWVLQAWGPGRSMAITAENILYLWPVAYPGILFGGVQQIQLRIEDRQNGDLGAIAP